jgi:hypothetical protein
MDTMKALKKITATAALGISGFLMMAGGCCWPEKIPTPPLGYQSDCIWRRQEASASASDFVVHQGEFATDTDSIQLNMAGEDHLKAIAARLHCGAPLPVIVERSMTSVNPESKCKYPVNPNPELDMKRREYIVKSLVSLGISNADQCVVVAPRLADGATATEAAQDYQQGLNGEGRNFGGFGVGRGGGLGGIGVGGTIR